MTRLRGALCVLLFVPCSLFAQSKAVTVRIDTPANKAVVRSASLVVTGIVTAPSPNVRVTVNGTAAELELTHAGTKTDPYRWTATLTPPQGKVKLKARAFIPKDATPDDEHPASTRHVDFLPAATALQVNGTPVSGLAPLDVTFDINVGAIGTVARFRADFDGNGTYELDGTTLPSPLTNRYTVAGTYVARFELTTTAGETHTGSVTIVVNGLTPVDLALREVWTGFQDALRAGDIATALTFFADARTREHYRPVLELIQPTLGQFASEIQLVGPVWITNRAAHYLLTRVENGETHGYHLYLARMGDGSWKIVKL